jgi:multiple sugar transport system ATP-binding protein
MPSLNVISVSKSFSDRKILDNVSVEIAEGELLVVLGPSGCGKTTLLRLIAGLEQVESGEIRIGSQRIDKLPPRKRNVALVFQNYALYPHMTVEQNLAFPLKVAKLSRKKIHEGVTNTATMLGLSDRLNDYPSQLSGGQRQRVALGRAIIRQPDLFLLDEPLSNLDADLRVRMRREIVELQKRLGVTTVHVTHDQGEALTMADRIMILNDGRVHQIGLVDDIYNKPADLFVATFVGTPKINLYEASLEGEAIQPLGISKVYIPGSYVGRDLVVGIRPEDVFLAPDGKYNAPVTGIEYLGDHTVATLAYLNHQIVLISKPGSCAVGDDVRFDIRLEKLHFFDKSSGVNLVK